MRDTLLPAIAKFPPAMRFAAVMALVVVALIGAAYAFGYIAVVWLWKLGSELKALGALVSARRRQPFAKTTVTGLSDAKEEVS